MNIFIGFGYNDRDKWIKELVFPLVQAFDGTVVTGEDLPGYVISQEVTKRIKKADGLLGFLTPRDRMESGKFSTHRWVHDELSTAIDNRVPAVEVREVKVDAEGGIAGDRQHLEFDESDKAKLLVELAKTLSTWRRKLKRRRLLLLPKEIVQDARPHISAGTLKCFYQFMDGSKESEVYSTKPFRFGRGLCVDIHDVPAEESLVQLTIQGPQFTWTSDYESVQLLSINLEKE